jgi:hypothetical protein
MNETNKQINKLNKEQNINEDRDYIITWMGSASTVIEYLKEISVLPNKPPKHKSKNGSGHPSQKTYRLLKRPRKANMYEFWRFLHCTAKDKRNLTTAHNADQPHLNRNFAREL